MDWVHEPFVGIIRLRHQPEHPGPGQVEGEQHKPLGLSQMSHHVREEGRLGHNSLLDAGVAAAQKTEKIPVRRAGRLVSGHPGSGHEPSPYEYAFDDGDEVADSFHAASMAANPKAQNCEKQARLNGLECKY
eukprot:758219-Hanusia_phi.AAC.4